MSAHDAEALRIMDQVFPRCGEIRKEIVLPPAEPEQDLSWMTEAQAAAFKDVKDLWKHVGRVHRDCYDAALMWVSQIEPPDGSEARGRMMLGIEPDGYTHS